MLKKEEIELHEVVKINNEAEEQKKQDQKEFNQNLADAGEEVLDRVYNSNTPFSYDDIEEIMNGYGLEMDYIEDILF